MPLCAQGCGREGKFYSEQTGHWRCEKFVASCPERRRLNAVVHGKEKEFLKNQALEKQQQAKAKELYNKDYFSLTKAEKTRVTSLVYYRVDHPTQSEQFLKKRRATSIELFGVESYSQTDEFKSRHRKTCLERYGVKNPFLIPEVQKFILERVKFAWSTGTANNKRKATNYRLYGTETPCSNSEIQKQRQKFSRENWGTNFPMQNPEVAGRSFRNSFLRKEFRMPSGDIRIVQGYEPYALAELLKRGLAEEDIITGASNVPKIWYEFKGTLSRYFVDIFIRSLNLCIEVKSTWTLDQHGKNKKMREIFELKRQAVLDAGYNFELILY
jgi:hypothetical protein